MAKEQEHDDVESVDDAAERHIQNVKDKVKEARDKEPDEPEDEPEVDADEDDDETDSEPTRKEKRQNRYRELQERAERLEREREQYAANQAQLMQQLMALQQPREPAVDPRKELDQTYEDTELELIDLRSRYSQMASHYAQQGQEMPREKMREFIAKQRELELKKQEAIGTYYARQNHYQGPDPAAQQRQLEVAVLRASNADVFQNQVAALHVDYAFKRMRAEGKPDSLETAQAAIAEARKVVLKKGPNGSSASPTQAQKSKYTGGSTGSAGGAAREVPVIRVGPEGRKMADAAFPHIKDDKKRYELWGKKQYEASRQSKKPA